MKQLKCESCGGIVDIDEDKEFATCPYCKTKYKLNETKNININVDNNIKDLFENSFKEINKKKKIFFIFFIIVFLIILSTGIYSMVNIQSKTNNNEYKNASKKISQNGFNGIYELYSGSQSKFFTEQLLNSVILNNQKNKDMLITIIYNDINTKDTEEIRTIKNSLDKQKYEIILNYNDDGYIDEIKIEEIK